MLAEPNDLSSRQRIIRFLSRFGEWLLFFSPALVFGLVWLITQIAPDLLNLSPAEQFFVVLIGVTAAGIVNLQKLGARRRLDESVERIERHIAGRAGELTQAFGALQRASVDALGELKQELVDVSLNVKVRNHQELDKYLQERIARTTVARIVDGDPSVRDLKLPKYYEQRDRLVKAGELEHWRLVRVEDEADLAAVEELMQAHATDPGLLVACLDDRPDDVPPLVSMLILDKEEVHFGEGFLGPNPTLHIDDVGIVQPDVAANFTRYFERQWNKATVVKDSHGIQQNGLQVVRDRLAGRHPIRLHQEDVSADFGALVLLTARMSQIDIVSHPDLTFDRKARRAYYTSLGKAIIEKAVHHRRVVWNEGHLTFVEHWLKEEPQLEDCAGLEIRFLHAKPTEPFFHFDLLTDERDLKTIVLYLAADDAESWIEVHDQKLANLMERDFEHLWRRAKYDVLKERTGSFQWELLAELKQRLSD